MAVEVRLGPGDWRPIDGEPDGERSFRIVQLTAINDDPEWLRAVRLEHRAETPDHVPCLVRRAALPERALRLLPARAGGQSG